MGLTRPADVAASNVAVTYHVFDLLRLDAMDARRLPLRTRKSLLRRALTFAAPLRFTTHRNEGGPELLDDACRRGWEGLIAKRADSTYRTRRSGDWLKLKCAQGQEFIVGGFTEPAGSREGFGALLIGYHADGLLHYAGKVGTGFDRRTLLDLRHRLDGLRAADSPFADRPALHGAHWVGRGSWRRSPSRSGRATVCCDTPAIKDCGTTRNRPTSSGSTPSHDRPQESDAGPGCAGTADVRGRHPARRTGSAQPGRARPEGGGQLPDAGHLNRPDHLPTN